MGDPQHDLPASQPSAQMAPLVAVQLGRSTTPLMLEVASAYLSDTDAANVLAALRDAIGEELTASRPAATPFPVTATSCTVLYRLLPRCCHEAHTPFPQVNGVQCEGVRCEARACGGRVLN
ncbi:hypothetical protein [Streptomyces sp. NPDC059649]|uniref:hypothetical protein n=1 Tax=Streptomyces sp. NPDC059649 TaxID=3346895 RepID=UPI003696D090